MAPAKHTRVFKTYNVKLYLAIVYNVLLKTDMVLYCVKWNKRNTHESIHICDTKMLIIKIYGGDTIIKTVRQQVVMKYIVHGSKNQNDRVNFKLTTTRSFCQYLGQVTENQCMIKACRSGSKHCSFV